MSGYCVISSELLLDAGHLRRVLDGTERLDDMLRRLHGHLIETGESYEPELFPRISSHDLRRSFGTWLRADGVPVSEVAAMLSHADSRMAERVYARLPPDLLRDLLTELCQPAAGQSVPKAGKDGEDDGAGSRNPSEEVPRGGIEPPTRGFSVSFSPSEKARFPLGASVKHVPRPVEAGTPKHGHARFLRQLDGSRRYAYDGIMMDAPERSKDWEATAETLVALGA